MYNQVSYEKHMFHGEADLVNHCETKIVNSNVGCKTLYAKKGLLSP